MAKLLAYLVRHGNTLLNRTGRYRGWADDDSAQLDDRGREAAKSAGLYLKATDFPKGDVFYSDLGRARETAEIIAAIIGRLDRCYADSNLRPLNVGYYQGQPKSQYPMRHFILHPSEKIPGGESILEFEQRNNQTFEKIIRESGPGVPIFVIHTSNLVALWNMYNPANRLGEECEEILQPGGVAMLTTGGVVPVYKESPTLLNY